MASRANIYKDYFPSLSAAAALRVLIWFAVGLLVAELAMRVINPRYARTAVSSLHGVRAILQQALEDPGPKILCFGDSSFVGGGIYRHDQTVAGYLAKEIEGPRVYNLALPGGDSVTTAMLLEQLREHRVANVDRVIIETLAGKWVAITPAEAGPTRGVLESGKELRRLIPGIDLRKWGLNIEPLPRPERVEVDAQWELGRWSILYRHRDYFRTEMMGNYPAFWMVGKAIPRSVMARLNPEKAKATNRLAARMDDFDFNPVEMKSKGRRRGRFSPDDERAALLQGIELAKSISQKPPVILAFPMFHEFQGLETEERQSFLQAIGQFESELQTIAGNTGSELMLVRSEEFLDPTNWTATPSHFNTVGARRIWESLRPRFCQWYRCVPPAIPKE